MALEGPFFVWMTWKFGCDLPVGWVRIDEKINLIKKHFSNNLTNMKKNEVRYVVDLPYKLKIVILQMKEGSNQKIVKV